MALILFFRARVFCGYNLDMSYLSRWQANAFRSLFFLFLAFLFGACASAPLPSALPLPTARVVIVVATNSPATATNISSPSLAPTNTLSPTATNSPPTLAPTDTAIATPTTHLVPTATFAPSTVAPTELAPTVAPTTAPTLQPTEPPTIAPTLAPTESVKVAPPASFAPTELVMIPGGILRMGGKGPEDDADEKPFHDVEMYEYRIEKYEVTNAQYQACVAAGVCPAPTKNSSYTRAAYFGAPEFANYPVVNVTWHGANAYCAWLGRRLPNEAEWERAAKGGDNLRYTWSNSIGMHFEWNAIFHGSPLSFCEASCPLQNYWGDVNDGFPDTAPIGSFVGDDPRRDNSSGFEVVDLAGNVAEWTNNWYYGNAYAEGMDIYGPSDATGVKTVRGGSWADEPRRNSDREPQAPDYSSDRIGFRCAQ